MRFEKIQDDVFFNRLGDNTKYLLSAPIQHPKTMIVTMSGEREVRVQSTVFEVMNTIRVLREMGIEKHDQKLFDDANWLETSEVKFVNI